MFILLWIHNGAGDEEEIWLWLAALVLSLATLAAEQKERQFNSQLDYPQDGSRHLGHSPEARDNYRRVAATCPGS